jgi:origin recognition complex subunit 3
MCHFYGNPLSWLSNISAYENLSKLIQPHHLEVVKTLPSFQRMVEGLVENKQLARAEALLGDDKALLKEIMNSLESKNISIIQLLQAMSILSNSSSESVNQIDLYMAAFQGGLARSDFVKRVIDSLKRMAPDDLVKFIEGLTNCIENGNSEVNLAGLRDEDDVLLTELREIQPQAAALAIESVKTGKPIRNSYAIHSKGLRTTVIAQRVQLSFENSTLTEQDIEFTALVDHLTGRLENYFSELKNPQEMFLNEVWLYDWTIPQKSVFMPRPREAIELALSTPYQYLSCECCESAEGLLSTHPGASILFQMCLETGSLINIFDLWSAFLEMVGGRDEQKCDERDALVMFYRGLADLKSLGIVKQSKKKADHLAKIAWKGL